MRGRHFDSTENGELRAKIDKAKRQLPLPDLMSLLGLGEHAKKSARCLWHDDQRPSFSVFKGDDGFWHYKCFVCDMQGGDEIAFLVKHFDISQREAIKRYLDMPVSLQVGLLSLVNILSLVSFLRFLGVLSLLCILCLLCPTDKD
jgi:hypothetical protein